MNLQTSADKYHADGASKQMQSVKQYQILCMRAVEIEDAVNQLLAEGWVCQGGATENQGWFTQAMILDLQKECTAIKH